MISDEAKMSAVVSAISKLSFSQLLVAQANLSEHIHLCFQHFQLEQLRQAEVLAQSEKTNPKPFQ